MRSMVEGLAGRDLATVVTAPRCGECARTMRGAISPDQPLHHLLKEQMVPLPVPGRSLVLTRSYFFTIHSCAGSLANTQSRRGPAMTLR